MPKKRKRVNLVFMEEKTRVFDSAFHQRYVGGEGAIAEQEAPESSEFMPETYEEILAQYRDYVNDPTAELPDELMEKLIRLGRV